MKIEQSEFHRSRCEKTKAGAPCGQVWGHRQGPAEARHRQREPDQLD
jgi:hypothetical protein